MGRNSNWTKNMRLKAIVCEILAREVYLCSAYSKHLVDVELVKKELHNTPANLKKELQEIINRCDDKTYQGILLVYGLCNTAVEGLYSEKIQLVIPRAHDCITLLYGSKEKYNEEFFKYPGTYYYSSGWLERGGVYYERKDIVAIQEQKTYQEYVDKYGEDNAKYLMEFAASWKKHYNRTTYIETDVVKFPELEEQVKQVAAENGWTYECVKGKIELVKKMINGEWDEEKFLVVSPGNRIISTNDENIMGWEKT